MPLVCKLCIVAKGIHGSQLVITKEDRDRSICDTEEELTAHMEKEHHLIVQRPGESLRAAFERVSNDPDACAECKESAVRQLAEINA